MSDQSYLDWPNHDDAWKQWRNASSGSRMHHAWILAGKKGLGKSDFAQAAARELVAEEGISQPSGDHPDIIELTYGPKNDKEAKAAAEGKKYETARSIRVDQIRDMQRRLTTRPTLGERRVIIINPADDMETSSSNALLKSLEEPPSGTFFLLVTHRPSRLLPTIRSRCRMLRFPLLSDVQLREMLRQEGVEHNAGALDAALQAAEGSYGAAMRFAEQDLGPMADHMDRLLKQGDAMLSGRAELLNLIGPRADRARLQAVFDLALHLVSSRARKCENSATRAKLIDAHADLVTLSGQAPTYNFDTGLLALKIGTLLMRAAPASEHAHG